MSYIEAVGTIFGIFNIWLASKEKIINFYFGLVNVTLFAIIFYQIQLYANLVLQIFFFVMNIYGLFSWQRNSDDNQLKIRWLKRRQLISITAFTLISIVLLANYIDLVFGHLAQLTLVLLQLINPHLTQITIQPDAYPLIDSAITVLSMVAMILMTRKYVENWLIWVLINILSIGLYAVQSVYLMSFEYLLLLFIAIHGSINWIKLAKAKS